MNPQKEIQLLEQLIDELLAGIQDVLQSGEVLSDEFQGMLAQELEVTTTRLDQLRGEVNQSQEIEQPVVRNNQTTEAISGPPSIDAQLLWILAGQQEQPFISYLREFPSPDTMSLLSNPSQLSRTIEQLTQSMPPGQAPVIGGVKQADLQSSNIWGTAYDPQTGKMKVRFQGGSEYEYEGVPANIYRAFAKGNASAKTQGKNQYGQWWVGKNPSLGAAMNQYIKAGGFNYRKLK